MISNTSPRTLCFSILRPRLRSKSYTCTGTVPPRPSRSATRPPSRKPYTTRASCSSPTVWSKLTQRPWTTITATAIAVATGVHYFGSRDHSDHHSTLVVDRYKPYRIKSVKYLSPDTALFEIDIPLLPADEDSETDLYIESIYVKHPALQIERPYTPLSALRQNQLSEVHGPDQEEPSTPTVELLVKRYPDGDLSSYLYRERLAGNDVEVRGPVQTWRHEGSPIDELIFIAAGTGITPAIQLLRRLYKHPARPDHKLPKFKLIYLTNSLESAHALAEIHKFCSRYPHLIKSRLVVEQPPTPNQSGPPVDKVGRLELGDLQQWLGDNAHSDRKRMILVCGPDGLINTVAGPKGRDFVSQGPLGGLLRTLGYTSDQVYKL